MPSHSLQDQKTTLGVCHCAQQATGPPAFLPFILCLPSCCRSTEIARGPCARLLGFELVSHLHGTELILQPTLKDDLGKEGRIEVL